MGSLSLTIRQSASKLLRHKLQNYKGKSKMTEKTERKDEESSRSRNINKIDFKNIDDDADDFGAAKFKTEVLSSRKINFNSDEEDADEEDNSGMDVDDSLSEEVPPSPEPFKTP